MTISERQLEEDEAKIDNLLHKILNSNDKIRELMYEIKARANDTYIQEHCRLIDMLTETITNLAMLADQIDVKDEEITKELEGRVKGELKSAVDRIVRAEKLLGEGEE